MGEPIRLHLGCGKRYWDGWVNIDIDPDIQTDHRADLRNLPFDDAYADEVAAIHIIEHFHITEARKALREWHRVLRPGGSLILECPDLSKCIANLIACPERVDLHMRGLYGDERFDKPFWAHRWAYTPTSLAAELLRAGFSKLAEEPPQFHNPIRDMRIVAWKR